jgi:hypothetical protein
VRTSARRRKEEEKILIAVCLDRLCQLLEWSAARHSTGLFHAATMASRLQVWMSAAAEADRSPHFINHSSPLHPTSSPSTPLPPSPALMPPFSDQSSCTRPRGAHHRPCARRELQSWVGLNEEVIVLWLLTEDQLPVRASGDLAGAVELLYHLNQCYVY